MHSKLNQTTLVGEDWDKYRTTKIGHSDSFWTTLLGKMRKSAKGYYSCPGARMRPSENNELHAECSSSVLRQSAPC